jgi:septal ring factor EnvC (AmiA/AmiB activator)
MCKKVLIAALAVVVGLAVVKGTKIGSHLRFQASKVTAWAERQVPPEQEIARLRMELRNLEQDDDKHYDKVAKMAVGVEKLEAEVARLKANLGKQETRISQLRDELTAGKEFVVHDGYKYTKGDLRDDALAFKAAEENYKSKEANLNAKKKHLALERKKLTELRTTREQMATELQRLETALAEERHAQAASESTIDDSAYRNLRKQMESVRDRIKVMQKKRELRGELQITPADEQSKRRDEAADKYIADRFSKKATEVADGKGND